MEMSPASEKFPRMYLSGSSDYTGVNFLKENSNSLAFKVSAMYFLYTVLESQIFAG